MNKNLFVSELLDVYGGFLSEKQRMLTEYYYNEDLSLSEIAENEGITRQGVNDLIKRAVMQLNELEEKCGYCKKFATLKELSSDIKGGNTEKIKDILNLIDEL
ncbi:MAG: hypothetical protein E7560_05640 [Ruminococcaceae bacterium]|nr:hypothetical protein [Oscillospiraceae bacterium]